MTDHRLTYTGTPVQGYRHPTPVEIRIAISDAILADHEADGDGRLPIPVRTMRLISEAISKACAEVVT